MTNFNGKLISNTYRSLLTVNASVTGTGITTSLVGVQTADGVQTAIKISTNKLEVLGNLKVADAVCAITYYGDGSNLTAVEASVAGSISITNAYIGGNVTITGNEVVGGTLTNTGAATFKDDVSVSGNVVIGGTVTISGANVQAANAKVCASAFYGDGANLTNVPASGNVSVSSLRVIGNASIGGTLSVAGAAGFGSTVTVAGNVSIGGTGTVGGAFAVSGGAIDLRTSASDPAYIRFYCESGNAHYAQLRSPPHASYSGNVTITLPSSTVTVVGTSTTDTLTNKTFGDATQFEAAVTVEGAAHLQSTVSVGGAAVFASTVTIVGAATFKDDVSVSGNTNLLGTVTIGGAVSLASSLSVGGAVNLLSTATITGAAGFLSTVRVAGATSIEGAAVLKSTVTVVGAAHLQSTVSVGGAAIFASTVTVVGAATFKDDVSVSGNTNLLGTVTVGGAVSLASSLSVGGATNLLSTVTVAGAAGFLGTVRISGNVSTAGTFYLTKSAAANVHTTAINGVASVSFGFGGAQNFSTTVTAAHVLARPTGAVIGQVGSIFFVQSGGSGALSYNGCWKFPAGTAPTFSTSNGAVDRLDYIVASVSSDGTGENIQAILSQEYS